MVTIGSLIRFVNIVVVSVMDIVVVSVGCGSGVEKGGAVVDGEVEGDWVGV